jgi:hypothetical protein
MEKSVLVIHYQRGFPIKAIRDFENLNIGKYLDANVYAEGEGPQAYHVSGGQPSDVLLFFSEHLTGVIVSGLLTNFAYDLLKSGVGLLWNALKQSLSEPKNQNKDVTQRHISMMLKFGLQTITIEIDGDLDGMKIDEILAQLIGFIRSSAMENVLVNRNYSSNLLVYEAVMRYSKEKEVWEAVDFGDYEKRLQEVYDKMRESGH